MVDRWVGRLMESVDRLDLRESTAIAFLSDHGIFLGEHNLLGKAGKREEDIDGWPPYREASAIPLMLRLPGVAPRRVGGFVSPGDLMPTLLGLAGVAVPQGVTASSLLPMAAGEPGGRGIAVTAWSYRGARAHHPTCIRTTEWSMVWWRSGIPPRLHHLASDPEEACDVYPQNRGIARMLHAEYVEFLKKQPVRIRNYWPRRFFFTWKAAPPAAVEQRAG
jgi:arylsulfatase A-like enzyme